MDVKRTNLDNRDIVDVTGVSAATIQTWANRGILALSEAQRNPGPGQKRLYSRLDAARIVVIQSLTTEHKMSANAAGQIAARLERGPQGAKWLEATERVAPHIHLFVSDGDVVNVYVGNDIQKLAQIFKVLNEPMEAGAIGREGRQVTQTTMNVALYDVGPSVSCALRSIAERRGSLAGRARVAHNNGLSSQFVLRNDEGRFIWCGQPIVEPPLAATSKELAMGELKTWARKWAKADTVTVEWL